jgi:hypothetical protein
MPASLRLMTAGISLRAVVVPISKSYELTQVDGKLNAHPRVGFVVVLTILPSRSLGNAINC